MLNKHSASFNDFILQCCLLCSKHNCNRGTQNLQEKIWETLLPNVIFTHLVSNRQVTEELDPTTKSWAIEDH